MARYNWDCEQEGNVDKVTTNFLTMELIDALEVCMKEAREAGAEGRSRRQEQEAKTETQSRGKAQAKKALQGREWRSVKGPAHGKPLSP